LDIRHGGHSAGTFLELNSVKNKVQGERKIDKVLYENPNILAHIECQMCAKGRNLSN